MPDLYLTVAALPGCRRAFLVSLVPVDDENKSFVFDVFQPII